MCDQEGARKRVPQRSQGSTSWSLVCLVRDSQGVLPPRGFGAVSYGCHRGTPSPHVLVQGRSIEKTLRVAASTDELEVKVLPHVAESRVRVLINNSTVGTEGKLPAPPSEVKQLLHEALVLMEVRQQELLVCAHTELGGHNSCQAWLVKEDSAARRYFCKPSRVYKGTQSTVVVNWSRGHSTRRPSALRIGSQWSVITSGRSDSDAAARGTKRSEVSMSFLEGMVPASNPRRLHLMHWTQLLSEVKVSYLLGRMSSSVTPQGRTASWGGVLLSSSSVAHFFGGNERGLLSSKGRFWFQAGSTLGVEAAWGISMGRSVSLSSDITTAATSSGSGPGRVWSRSIPPCSRSLFSLAVRIWGTSLPLREGPGTPQALFHLGGYRLSGYLWPPKETNIADEP